MAIQWMRKVNWLLNRSDGINGMTIEN